MYEDKLINIKTDEKIVRLTLIFFIIVTISILSFAKYSDILVKTEPSIEAAEIFLDNNKVGITGKDGKLYIPDVPIGDHSIRVIKKGYSEFGMDFKLGKYGPKQIIVTLTKTISDKGRIIKPLKGSYEELDVTLECNKKNAEVYLDGRYIGAINSLGKIEFKASSGRHTIEVMKKGFSTVKQNIYIQSQKSTKFRIDLTGSRRGSDDSLFIIILFIIFGMSFFVLIYVLIKNIISRGRIRFDRYVIHNIIGRGGMATIYKAKDITSGQFVALKILDSAFLNDRDLVRKFIREGWAVSEINKDFPEAPVVKVYHYGRENNRTKGRPFIAMEYLQGQNLLSYIRTKRPLNINFVYKVIKQIAKALDAAHQKGIYHRDVTPDNIIVVRNDLINPIIKLIDFGVARHEYTAVGTLDGSIAGKPPYMSPEQCRGEKVDRRSDIYSLGILFYTLLNGSPPFVSRNPFEVMKAHEQTPVPPLTRNVPDGIKTVLYKMLRKNKQERFRSLNEFLKNFQKVTV